MKDHNKIRSVDIPSIIKDFIDAYQEDNFEKMEILLLETELKKYINDPLLVLEDEITYLGKDCIFSTWNKDLAKNETKKNITTILHLFSSIKHDIRQESSDDIIYETLEWYTYLTQLAIELGASVNVHSSNNAYTPLHMVVNESHKYDNRSIIRALIDNGADIIARDGSGNTPLHCIKQSDYCAHIINIFTIRAIHNNIQEYEQIKNDSNITIATVINKVTNPPINIEQQFNNPAFDAQDNEEFVLRDVEALELGLNGLNI